MGATSTRLTAWSTSRGLLVLGDLIINGSVNIITNQVSSDLQEDGHARICLSSIHGDVDINGEIVVNAHLKNSSNAAIHINAGANVTVNLRPEQQIDATSRTSKSGPAEASVLIHAGKNMEGQGNISIIGDKNIIKVYAKAGGGTGTVSLHSNDDPVYLDQIDGYAHAVLEIDENYIEECPDCPTPPDLP